MRFRVAAVNFFIFFFHFLLNHSAALLLVSALKAIWCSSLPSRPISVTPLPPTVPEAQRVLASFPLRNGAQRQYGAQHPQQLPGHARVHDELPPKECGRGAVQSEDRVRRGRRPRGGAGLRGVRDKERRREQTLWGGNKKKRGGGGGGGGGAVDLWGPALMQQREKRWQRKKERKKGAFWAMWAGSCGSYERVFLPLASRIAAERRRCCVRRLVFASDVSINLGGVIRDISGCWGAAGGVTLIGSKLYLYYLKWIFTWKREIGTVSSGELDGGSAGQHNQSVVISSVSSGEVRVLHCELDASP